MAVLAASSPTGPRPSARPGRGGRRAMRRRLCASASAPTAPTAAQPCGAARPRPRLVADAVAAVASRRTPGTLFAGPSSRPAASGARSSTRATPASTCSSGVVLRARRGGRRLARARRPVPELGHRRADDPPLRAARARRPGADLASTLAVRRAGPAAARAPEDRPARRLAAHGARARLDDFLAGALAGLRRAAAARRPARASRPRYYERAHALGVPLVTTCYAGSSPETVEDAASNATAYLYLVSQFGTGEGAGPPDPARAGARDRARCAR